MRGSCDQVRSAAGTGSAVLGLLQFGLAGAVAPIVGVAGEHTALPLALTMLTAAVLADLALTVGRRSVVMAEPVTRSMAGSSPRIDDHGRRGHPVGR